MEGGTFTVFKSQHVLFFMDKIVNVIISACLMEGDTYTVFTSLHVLFLKK